MKIKIFELPPPSSINYSGILQDIPHSLCFMMPLTNDANHQIIQQTKVFLCFTAHNGDE